MSNIVGIDIGGTKTSVVIGDYELNIIAKEKFKTLSSLNTLNRILQIIENYKIKYGEISNIGIVCGGPLSSSKGLIICPPNLPDWRNIEIVKYFSDNLNIPVRLENDANACAMAEYLWGNGKNTNNMAFLTFGTGLGAGLILNNKLYRGSSDMAGEVGHIRLNESGPIGYNKAGSFEGFCSGGGIAELCKIRMQENNKDAIEFIKLIKDETISAEILANAVKSGNKFAISIFEESAAYLGKGLSILIDILNLDKIIIGGIYARMESFFKDIVLSVIKEEALECSYNFCSIEPAFFGEEIGDYSALAVAANKL